ncbi:DNA repair protein RadA [Candidatus Peregrinibacteria bacterium]|nr:DNA repair protein RadA [Candidatus Peregrinibacteria bacterium]
MVKTKTIYICSNCKTESPKWQGKCNQCNEWGTFTEEISLDKKNTFHSQNKISSKPQSLFKTSNQEDSRILTEFNDFNTLLGGGFKQGGLTLLSGEPGVGKSTLTLQICKNAAEKVNQVFYFSGEESPEQIASRAERLKISNQNIQIVSETNLEAILNHLNLHQPEFVIIDSIQVLNSGDIPSLAGSINQVRYCTECLMGYAKNNNCTMIIIGHITKDGHLAGPKLLEHLVDTVLFIEGDRMQNYRIIRSLKNRFGSTNEISIMEMQGIGLKEMANPSKIFLEGRNPNAIGSAITVTMEGAKPILLEVQALTHPTAFGYPKRTASGYDLNRTNLLAAVLGKYLKMNLNSQDLYINIIGGLKLRDTSSDLAVAMAIISSFKKIIIPSQTLFLGEIGLSGEIRNIPYLEKRLKEAKKLGFEKFIIPRSDKKIKDTFQVKNLEEAVKLLT